MEYGVFNDLCNWSLTVQDHARMPCRKTMPDSALAFETAIFLVIFIAFSKNRSYKIAKPCRDLKRAFYHS